MKKLLFILSIFITSMYTYGQSTPDTVFLKIKSGGGTIDSLNVSKLNGGKIDTVHIPISIVNITQQGTGYPMVRGSGDTIYSKNIEAGTNVTLDSTDGGVKINVAAGASGISQLGAGYLLTKVNDSTYNSDTAAVSVLYPRRKDSTVSFTTPYQSSLKQNISDSTTKYVTPTQLNQKATNWFNILKYGASPSNTSTQNTTAINSAIAAALVVKGTVYIPSGIYLVDSLTGSSVIQIVGDGLGSILRSNSAVALLTISGAYAYSVNSTISNIVLDGNGIGITGLNMSNMNLWNISNVFIENFTGNGAYMLNSYIGTFSKCFFYNNGNGFYLKGCNLVTFYSPIFQKNTGVALVADGCAHITVNNGDFEQNGTVANAATGAIYAVGTTSDDIGMEINSCWFEVNNGVLFNIGAPAGHPIYNINSSNLSLPNVVTQTILMASTANIQYLNITNSTVKGATVTDISVLGSATVVSCINSVIGTTSAAAGSIVSNIPAGTITGGSAASVLVTGGGTVNALAITNTTSGTSGGVTFSAQNTNTAGQSAFILQNNRGSYASYGGLLYGGATVSGSGLFGAANRQDKMFLFADGASNLGFYIGNLQSQPVVFGTNNLERMRILGNGNVGIGVTAPTATLQLKAGIATAGGQPIQYTAGILSTIPVSGEVGTDATNNLYYTNSSGIRARQAMWAYKAVTSTYTATDGDYTIDCTGGGTFTVTLPASIAGRPYTITNSGTGTITIATTSSQTFTNVATTPTTLSIVSYGTYQVQGTGSAFVVISKL